MKPLAVVLVALICGLALAQYPGYPGSQARSGNGGLWGLILCLFLFFFLFNIFDSDSDNAVTRVVFGNFSNGPVTFNSG